MPPKPPRPWPEEPEREDIDPEAAEVLEDEAFQSLDGTSGEVADPAFQPVIEAGGGVAEGFEQAEAELIDHATDEDADDWERISGDAGAVEATEDPGVYGEADHEYTSEGVDEE
jgi:hypothetical protein